MKKLFILIPLFALCFTSCKKWQHRYPEDTERTKKTPEERLTGKTWTLTYASLNGIDYTDSVHQTLGKYQVYFTNTKDKHISGSDEFTGTAYNDYKGNFGIDWSFNDKYESLFYFRYTGVPSFPVAMVLMYMPEVGSGLYGQHPKILKLSTSELKFSITSKTGDSVVINSFISN